MLCNGIYEHVAPRSRIGNTRSVGLAGKVDRVIERDSKGMNKASRIPSDPGTRAPTEPSPPIHAQIATAHADLRGRKRECARPFAPFARRRPRATALDYVKASIRQGQRAATILTGWGSRYRRPLALAMIAKYISPAEDFTLSLLIK